MKTDAPTTYPPRPPVAAIADLLAEQGRLQAADTARPVWYAAFGSNLSRDRLLCYLKGGRAGRSAYGGCRDATPPADDEPCVIGRQLYFAGHSATWGGAVAFVDHQPDGDAHTLGRRYLLTAGQVADVAAQESGRTRGPALDLQRLARQGAVTVGGGFYDRIVYLGEVGGHPVVTCTSPQPLAARQPRLPSTAYLDVMVAGLVHTHGLTAAQALGYLARQPGLARAGGDGGG